MFSLWIDCDFLYAPGGISSRSLILVQGHKFISFMIKLKFVFNVFFHSAIFLESLSYILRDVSSLTDLFDIEYLSIHGSITFLHLSI